MGSTDKSESPPSVRPIVELDVNLTGELANTGAISSAGYPEATSLAQTGVGVQNATAVAGLKYGATRYQAVANFEGMPNYYSLGGALWITNAKGSREPDSLFMPREGFGYENGWLNSPSSAPSGDNVYDLSFFFQGIHNDYPTIITPDQNVLFGFALAVRLDDNFLAGLEYRDSEIVYNSEIALGDEALEISAPWRRVRLHAGLSPELPDGHEVNIGAQAGLEERGYLLRFPLGPFASYKGEVGPVDLGVGAHLLYTRDILKQEYEFVTRIEPFVEHRKSGVRLSAWAGNENPYSPDDRYGARLTWTPRLENSPVSPSLSTEGEFIDADDDYNIGRGALTVGAHYELGDDSDEETSEIETLPPAELDDDEPVDDRPSPHLYGRWHLTSGIGGMYYQNPFSRVPSNNYVPPDLEVTTEDIRDLIDICCDAGTIEDLVNSGIAEQGPINFNGNALGVWGANLTVAGNLYANKKRTAQVFWLIDGATVALPGDGVSMSRASTGLGVARPVELGSKGLALPLRVSGGLGVGSQNVPTELYSYLFDDFVIGKTGTGVFGQVDLLEKTWGQNKMVYSGALALRFGMFGYSINHIYGYDENFEPVIDTHRDWREYALLSLKLGAGQRIRPRKEKGVRETLPPTPVERPTVYGEPSADCPDPIIVTLPRLGPDILSEESEETILMGLYKDTLNGFMIAFQEDAPKPVVEPDGSFDKLIEGEKRLARKYPGRLDPGTEEEPNQTKIDYFLEQLEPQQFLVDRGNVLKLIMLARSMKEILENDPTVKIVIYGNANSRGTADYNEKLSQNRAELIMYYLILLGVDGSRMEVQAEGEFKRSFNEEEITEDFEDAAYSVNRRVIFGVEPM